MSTDAALNRLMNNVRVKCPGVVDDAIRTELFNVLDVFFQTTKAWKEDIEFTTTANDDTYEIEGFERGKIESLLRVQNENDIPVAATMENLGEVVLATTPSTAETFTATVSLTVKDPVDSDGYPEFPDWLLLRWREVILDGLIGGLFAQKAKPYSDERLAIFHQRRFRNGMATARNIVNRKNTYNAQAWCFPRFA